MLVRFVSAEPQREILHINSLIEYFYLVTRWIGLIEEALQMELKTTVISQSLIALWAPFIYRMDIILALTHLDIFDKADKKMH